MAQRYDGYIFESSLSGRTQRSGAPRRTANHSTSRGSGVAGLEEQLAWDLRAAVRQSPVVIRRIPLRPAGNNVACQSNKRSFVKGGKLLWHPAS